jgi:L-2-hydroxyglutarate oxidase LhgO
MKVIVLGAGVVGTATAYFLARHGCEVEVIERQQGAALETSFGNGGVIHASEVEPWSQPGMPLKILKWLGKALGDEVHRQLHGRAIPPQHLGQSQARFAQLGGPPANPRRHGY